MQIESVTVGSVLTRTSGFLRTVTSHSLQPYRGCPLGRSLCGVGCYVQHFAWVTEGRRWGGFLEVKQNAAEAYRSRWKRERAWARARRGGFSIFLSSSTEPFPPQERRYRVTRAVLEAMLEQPADSLVLQTHSPTVAEHLPLLRQLAARCNLRIHVSIETDRERLPGLPRHGASVDARFAAARRLHEAGLRTIITVAPLLPIADPDAFFSRVAECADAVVLDHFVGGDGSPGGSRTHRTALPRAMAAIDPDSPSSAYRDAMAEVARRYLPGRVGIHVDGFAGRFDVHE